MKWWYWCFILPFNGLIIVTLIGLKALFFPPKKRTLPKAKVVP